MAQVRNDLTDAQRRPGKAAQRNEHTARLSKVGAHLTSRSAARLTVGLAVLAGLAGLTACGAVRSAAGRTSGGGVASGCVTTVRGVVDGPGSLTATWLPPGYRLRTGSQPPAGLPAASYVEVTGHPDPPRLMLSSISRPGPLTAAAAGGRANGVPVLVNGRHGLLESGPPARQFTGVYWKPGPAYLLGVVGYRVPAAIVLKVARRVSFLAPGIVTLPVAPGRIIARRAAIAAAERATGAGRRHAAAKLSSWTEVAALAAQAQHIPPAPPELTRSPWRPVWAVLLTGLQAAPVVVVVDAGSGQAEATLGGRGSWFPALTDRDSASTGRCPGGSTARLPFGVLTRNEQEYAAAPGRAGQHARASVRLVLSTVPRVNRADNGLYGGCGQQDCSIDQLVWVTITTIRAAPGRTVACLPGSVSVPPGYQPKQVKQYYSVAVPGNVGIGCGRVPGSVRSLTDLAPPG